MVRFAALSSLVVGCFSPTPPRGLPCSSDNACPSGQTCDLITKLCDGDSLEPGERSWVDDTAEDFQAGTHLDEVAIEPGGFVGPRGYFTGVLRTRGFDSKLIVDPATATFDAIVANPSTGTGFSRSWTIQPGNEPVPGLGTLGQDNMTVAVEGEIELTEAGDYRFQLLADDMGFLDLAPPGGSFERVIEDEFDARPAQVAFTVVTPGWYRFRGAFQDNTGLSQLNFQIDAPGVGGFRPVNPDRMRVRTDDQPGTAIDGFDDAFDLLYGGSSSALTLDHAYGMEPFGIPLGFIAYSIRSSGQLLIDTEGDYVLSIDSVQGHRMWLDGQLVADAFSLQAEATITGAIHLTAGWHDFVVDVHKRGGQDEPKLALSIQSGPVTGAIASDHLRPVVGRAQRFAAGGNANELAIADGGSTVRPVNLVQPADFVVEDIRFGIQLDHPDRAQLAVLLDPPAGPDVDVATAGSLGGAGVINLDGVLPATSSGTSYAFTISDALADTIVGTVVQAGVTQLGSGGRAPFETSYRFESAIRDLGSVTEFREMQWRLRQGELAASAMQLRTCDVEAECETAEWTDVAPGSIPQVAPRRFAQYGITITTDGDVPTALDVVELRYVVQP